MLHRVFRSLIVMSALAATLVCCDQGRAEGLRGLEVRGTAAGSSLVGSFLQSDSPDLAALEGSFAVSPPELSVPAEMLAGMSAAGAALATALLPEVPAADTPTRLMSARPRLQRETVTTRAPAATEPVTRRAKSRSGPDPLEVSRSAFPLLVGPMPASLADIRPMAGPVVGVRPAYIRPAQTR